METTHLVKLKIMHACIFCPPPPPSLCILQIKMQTNARTVPILNPITQINQRVCLCMCVC